MTTRYTNLPDNKDKPFGGAYSVHDPETCRTRDEAVKEYIDNNAKLDNEAIKSKYVQTYKKWMFATHPKIKGWEDYNELCFTQGTTESFAQFYLRFRESKRLRLAKGEYFYNQMMKGLWYKGKFAWLGEDEIRSNDVVLISVPFSDTGAVPDYLEKLLTECDNNDVPVMLDLAYINLSVDLEIDLTHRCIEYVVSSLSKVFPVELHRIGIRMQRTKFEDQLYVVNGKNHNYINVLSAYVGTKLMEKYPANYIYNKYRQKQLDMCDKLNLEASPCVYFGIDKQRQFSEYNRGTESNRLCFTRIWDGRMKDDNEY
jgi:hypothetical protein